MTNSTDFCLLTNLVTAITTIEHIQGLINAEYLAMIDTLHPDRVFWTVMIWDYEFHGSPFSTY